MADTTKTTSADALGLDAQAEMLKTERRANNVWNKLKRNKTAMIGLVIVVVMVSSPFLHLSLHLMIRMKFIHWMHF